MTHYVKIFKPDYLEINILLIRLVFILRKETYYFFNTRQRYKD